MRYVAILKREWNTTTSELGLVPTGETGVFHQFGVNFDELDHGAGSFTSAIVEMPDGTVRNLELEEIKFIEGPNGI